jgi:hypothetical protein
MAIIWLHMALRLSLVLPQKSTDIALQTFAPLAHTSGTLVSLCRKRETLEGWTLKILAQLDAQRELACSTDCADQGNSPRWFQSDEG